MTQHAKLKYSPSSELSEMYKNGLLTHFEFMFSEFLKGEISWPDYRPEDVVRIRKRYNLSREALADLFDLSVATMARWEKVENAIPTPGRIALCVLDKLGDNVFELMSADATGFDLKATDQKSADTAKDMVSNVNDNLRARKIATASLPEEFDATVISNLRVRLGYTRAQFARLLGVSKSALDKWEGGSIAPKGPALKLLQMIYADGIAALDINRSNPNP